MFLDRSWPIRGGAADIYDCSPIPVFFCFCTSNPRLLHTSEKTRSNISVNGMALFVLFTTCVKGKTFADTHGERGGLPTRGDSGPTRYEQPIMRTEDRLFDRGWVRSAMATRKCGNIYVGYR